MIASYYNMDRHFLELLAVDRYKDKSLSRLKKVNKLERLVL